MYARTRLRRREVVSATEKALERRDCNTCIARECYRGACGGIAFRTHRAAAYVCACARACVCVCVYSVFGICTKRYTRYNWTRCTREYAISTLGLPRPHCSVMFEFHAGCVGVARGWRSIHVVLHLLLRIRKYGTLAAACVTRTYGGREKKMRVGERRYKEKERKVCLHACTLTPSARCSKIWWGGFTMTHEKNQRSLRAVFISSP